MNWQERKTLVKSTFLEFFRERSLMHGAALSYYFMLALVPMLYLSVTYVGMIFGEESVRTVISELMCEWIGLDDADSILGFLDQVNFSKSSVFLQVVGIIALLFSCSAIFNALRQSLNTFYDIDTEQLARRQMIVRNIVGRLVALLFVVAGSVLIVVIYFAESLFLSFAMDILKDLQMISGTVMWLINHLLPIVTNIIVFWFVFMYMNDGKVSGKIALRGSLLTSLLLFVGQVLIKYYLTNYFFAAHGGMAGTMLVILVWVYYTSQIIFFGAKYIAVFSRMKGKPIKHVMIKS